jgi:hypothetical protein
MDKVHYWFLDRAVRSPYSLSSIIPYDQRDGKYIDRERTPSSLTLYDIVEELYFLNKNNMILFTKGKYAYDRLLKDLRQHSLHLNKKGIRNAIDRNMQVAEKTYEEYQERTENNFYYYFLTELGAAAWESFTHPRWNVFFRCSPMSWETTNKNISLKLDSYYRSRSHSLYFSWQPEICFNIANYHQFFDCIDPQKIIYHPTIVDHFMLFPWHPTYWKSLNSGVIVVTYDEDISYLESSYNKSPEFIAEVRSAQEWFNLMRIVNWYNEDLLY